MSRRSSLLWFFTGVVATIVVGYLAIRIVGRSESEKPEAIREEPYADFPSFFVSDSSLTDKASRDVSVRLTGKENKQGIAVGYCIVLSDNRWTCGETDGAGNAHRIYASQAPDLRVYSGDAAMEIWNNHVQGKSLKTPQANCLKVSGPSGTDSREVFQCQGW